MDYLRLAQNVIFAKNKEIRDFAAIDGVIAIQLALDEAAENELDEDDDELLCHYFLQQTSYTRNLHYEELQQLRIASPANQERQASFVVRAMQTCR